MLLQYGRRLALPVAALAAVAFAAQQRLDLELVRLTGFSTHTAALIVAIAGWLIGSMATNRLIELLIWERAAKRRGQRVPRLLMQLTKLGIYLVAAATIATNVFGMPLTGVIATSSVIGLVVGFATKSLISDTFSGIALNLDSGFGIGDFVKIHGRGFPAKIHGRVTEINWRSTYILTPENSVLVIPNTVMTEAMVLNMSKPDVNSEFEHVVVLDFEVPSEQAIRLLRVALEAAALDNPAVFGTSARIHETSEVGVHYKVKYMLDPSRLAPGKAKDLVYGHLLRHLAKAGVALAHPKQDSWVVNGGLEHFAAGSSGHRRNLIRQVDLFRELEAADIATLATRMRERRFAAGTPIICAGEPGESMFVISEGLVAVRLRAGEQEVDVARLAPGDFFGEMSVLTGEPRSASVVALTETLAYEIGKADMAALLETNPGAAETLSEAAAERRLMSNAAALTQPPERVAAEKASLAGQILSRMTSFFGRLRRPVLAS